MATTVTIENLYSEILEVKQLAMIQAKEALSMDEAVIYTSLSKSYLYHLVSDKKIPFYKSQGGGKTYFKKSELDEWLLSARYDTVSETEAKVLNNSLI